MACFIIASESEIFMAKQLLIYVSENDNDNSILLTLASRSIYGFYHPNAENTIE